MANLDSEQIDALTEARRILSRLDHDCDCHWGNNGPPTDDSRSCDTCQTRLAVRKIDSVLMPRIEGLHPNRMKNQAERIYVERFRKQCERKPCLNGGFGTLELLLQPEGSKHVPAVTQRDAHVATTIIQWLGTNCGRCFIQECEREISMQGVERRVVEGWYGELAYNLKPVLQVKETAKRIAEDYISIDKHPRAAKALADSIVCAIEKFAKSNDQYAAGVVYDC